MVGKSLPAKWKRINVHDNRAALGVGARISYPNNLYLKKQTNSPNLFADWLPHEEEDPRAVLVRRLQEYERFRDAATQLDERPRLERELYLVQARIEDDESLQDETVVDLSQLLSAMRDAMLRVDQRRNLQLVPETLSVRDRMNQVLTRVRSGEYVRIEEFFSVDEGRAGLVVSFLV